MDAKTETFRNGLAAGDRRALARAITLVESTTPRDRDAADALLAALPPADPPALRLGLSGTPGVGKSTFIEAFGIDLAEAGHRVAVLAVDPTSARTGGSILGDKTRMEKLSRHPAAFIRPSPAGAQLGGVARRTREAIRLVEAAGFDIVIVETVGVGQSETMVAEMTDIFLLLLAPAGGDELQGVKRGIMEIADLILVNKADGGLKDAARRTCADYAGALRLLRPRKGDPDGYPRALCVSAATGAGLSDARDAIFALARHRAETGALAATRAEQDGAWFRAELERSLMEHIRADPALSAARAEIERRVAAGRTTPRAGAAELLSLVLPGKG